MPCLCSRNQKSSCKLFEPTIANCPTLHNYFSFLTPISIVYDVWVFCPASFYLSVETDIILWKKCGLLVGIFFQLEVRSTVSHGDLVYDYCWHGGTESFYAVTSRDHPVHMWNSQGSRVATFRAINHLVNGVFIFWSWLFLWLFVCSEHRLLQNVQLKRRLLLAWCLGSCHKDRGFINYIKKRFNFFGLQFECICPIWFVNF